MAFGGLGGCLPLRLGRGEDTGISAECHARLAADLLAVHRTSEVARIQISADGATTGIHVSTTGYTGRNGQGIAAAPLVVSGTSPNAVYVSLGASVNTLGQSIDLAPHVADGAIVIAYRLSASGGTWVNAWAPIEEGRVVLSVPSAELTLFDVHIFSADQKTTIGDYGGHVLKHDSTTENGITYAFRWYEYLKTAQGSAYTRDDNSVRAWGLKAEARALGTSQRHAEMLAASVTPGGSDAKLKLWQVVLGVQSAARSKSSIRAECEIKGRPPAPPTHAYLTAAISDILGKQATLTGIYQHPASMSDWPLGTYWPGYINGTGSLDMGAGVWSSPRSRVTLQISSGYGVTDTALTTLMTRDVRDFMDRVLPATDDWTWETGQGNGIILGTSKLGFTAFAPAPATSQRPYILISRYDTNEVLRLNVSSMTFDRVITTEAGPQAIVVVGGFVYCANTTAGTLSKFPVDMSAIPVSLAVGGTPRGIAWDGANHLYVTNFTTPTGTVTLVALDTFTVDATVTVGARPMGVTPGGDGCMYVANSTPGNVSRVSIASRTVTGTITVGSNPQAIAQDGLGNVYVGNVSSGTVSVIATATGTVVATISGFHSPSAIIWDLMGHMHVANYGSPFGIAAVNIATLAIDATIATGSGPGVLTSGSRGGIADVYAANRVSDLVTRIDAATALADAIIPLTGTIYGMAWALVTE